MKSYIYLLLFALALPAVPLANAGQAEDPALEAAHQAFEEALNCVRPPYAKVEWVFRSNRPPIRGKAAGGWSERSDAGVFS